MTATVLHGPRAVSTTAAAAPSGTVPPRPSVYGLTFAALERHLVADGLAPIHARTAWQALYGDRDVPLTERDDLVPPLQRWARAVLGPHGRMSAEAPSVAVDLPSADGLTRKLLLRLADGHAIETVVMRHAGRDTACVSTQVGCAMGCGFCATGQMGFARHLTPGEIVAQVLAARRIARARGTRLRNLVLMGMGEPLHNYDAVMTALAIVTDRGGINIGPGRITISTVGVVPGILRLAADRAPYHLAVSLHGATDATRSALVPAGHRWPLDELMATCRAYADATGRKIFFEWTLIEGVTDAPAAADELVVLLEGLSAHVNLIPLNPTPGFPGAPSAAAAVLRFQQILRTAGVPSTVRQRRGIDVAAGCGMLGRSPSRHSHG